MGAGSGDGVAEVVDLERVEVARGSSEEHHVAALAVSGEAEVTLPVGEDLALDLAGLEIAGREEARSQVLVRRNRKEELFVHGRAPT